MNDSLTSSAEEHVARYLERVLEARSPPAIAKGAGRIGMECWADAPWRMEPSEGELPLTFIVRDAEGAGLRLEEICVWEAADDGRPWRDKEWQLVERFTVGLGPITGKFWTYRLSPTGSGSALPGISLDKFNTICKAVDGKPVPVRGKRLLLKVEFRGQRQGFVPFDETRYLAVYLASEPLPLRQSPRWYYGDTHYHSSYTNDIKEYGNPIPDTRTAAECIGLDWLVITDHSVDLVDHNPYWEDRLPAPDDRWEALGREAREHSDDRFRILRGEEVTLIGQPSKGDDTLHALVFGAGLDEMIPGAFARSALLDKVAALLSRFSREAFAHLFGPVHRLEEVLTGVSQSGEAVHALRGRSVQAQGALAFAAHPASMAQAPGGTWGFYDLMQPIHGVEAWNGRVRLYTGKEECPFDHWQEHTPWERGASKKGIEMWDQVLRQRAGLEDPRFVLLAGSDAHGSFNYSEGWWVDWDGLCANDNSLGKVRTLLYLPGRGLNSPRRAPTEEEVTDAIREGRCVVTDGPVLSLSLCSGGDEAGLGGVIHVREGEPLDVHVRAASTGEFGPVKAVTVVYYVQGMDTSVARMVPFEVGRSEIVANDLPPGAGYVRLETVTTDGNDVFRCFTNPVWFRAEGSGMRSLRVHCAGDIAG